MRRPAEVVLRRNPKALFFHLEAAQDFFLRIETFEKCLLALTLLRRKLIDDFVLA